MFEDNRPLMSIWIGNRTVATAHYDMTEQHRLLLVGRRRFTLFPPEQVHNLYPGPLEPTPAAQVISMVDFARPDFERYPRFREALAAGQVAEMEPGDVLVYPAHVVAPRRGAGRVQRADELLVERGRPATSTPRRSPCSTRCSACATGPQQEKAAWKALFDYYVFGAGRARRRAPARARARQARRRWTRRTARRLRAHA